jgi:hypothetical protein
MGVVVALPHGTGVIVATAGAVVNAGVGVEDGVEIALEDFEQDVIREALGTVVVVEGFGEAGDAVAGGNDGAEVVGDHDEGKAVLLLEVFEEVEEFFLAGLIDAGGRFVEEEDLRLIDQGTGDEDALLLAAGEAADGLVGKVVHFDGLEGIEDALFLLAGEAAEEILSADESEEDDLFDRDWEVPIEDVALWDVADEGAVGAGIAWGAAEDGDGAGIRRHDAEHEFHEGRLAAAVGTDDAEGGAIFDVEGDVLESGAAVVGERDVVDADDILGLGVGAQVGMGVDVGVGGDGDGNEGHG